MCGRPEPCISLYVRLNWYYAHVGHSDSDMTGVWDLSTFNIVITYQFINY